MDSATDKGASLSGAIGARLPNHCLLHSLNLPFVIGNFGRDVASRHRTDRQADKEPPGHIG